MHSANLAASIGIIIGLAISEPRAVAQSFEIAGWNELEDAREVAASLSAEQTRDVFEAVSLADFYERSCMKLWGGDFGNFFDINYMRAGRIVTIQQLTGRRSAHVSVPPEALAAATRALFPDMRENCEGDLEPVFRASYAALAQLPELSDLEAFIQNPPTAIERLIALIAERTANDVMPVTNLVDEVLRDQRLLGPTGERGDHSRRGYISTLLGLFALNENPDLSDEQLAWFKRSTIVGERLNIIFGEGRGWRGDDQFEQSSAADRFREQILPRLREEATRLSPPVTIEVRMPVYLTQYYDGIVPFERLDQFSMPEEGFIPFSTVSDFKIPLAMPISEEEAASLLRRVRNLNQLQGVARMGRDPFSRALLRTQFELTDHDLLSGRQDEDGTSALAQTARFFMKLENHALLTAGDEPQLILDLGNLGYRGMPDQFDPEHQWPDANAEIPRFTGDTLAWATSLVGPDITEVERLAEYASQDIQGESPLWSILRARQWLDLYNPPGYFAPENKLFLSDAETYLESLKAGYGASIQPVLRFELPEACSTYEPGRSPSSVSDGRPGHLTARVFGEGRNSQGLLVRILTDPPVDRNDVDEFGEFCLNREDVGLTWVGRIESVDTFYDGVEITQTITAPVEILREHDGGTD